MALFLRWINHEERLVVAEYSFNLKAFLPTAAASGRLGIAYNPDGTVFDVDGEPAVTFYTDGSVSAETLTNRPVAVHPRVEFCDDATGNTRVMAAMADGVFSSKSFTCDATPSLPEYSAQFHNQIAIGNGGVICAELEATA